jgi:adenylyl-sulfate kinase
MSSSPPSKSTNTTWHDQSVSRENRWNQSGHKGCVVWFTGLSGAGKSSVANRVECMLQQQQQQEGGGGNSSTTRTYLLDGDNIRHGLCQDLGFSLTDRAENIRRIGQVAKLMADAGMVVLVALISPYRADRDSVRQSVMATDLLFCEIHVHASLSTCEGRDPKGLYQMARDGKLKNFTGIDDPYEAPLIPELVLDSDAKSVEDLAKETVSWLEGKIQL